MFFSIVITLIFVLSALGYGGLFLRLTGQNNYLFTLGTGFWLISSGIYLIGLAGELRTPVLWSVLLIGCGLSLIQFSKYKRSIVEKQGGVALSTFNIWLSLLLLIIAIPAVLALLGALTPSVERDSLVYHLALPKLYLESGHWNTIPHNIYSFFPGLAESLYTLALGLGSEYPALMHFIFGLACLAATYELGRLIGLHREIRLLCVLGVLVTPTFFLEMTWSYVDLAMSFYWLLTVIAFFYWMDERKAIRLVFLGIFMGGAMSSKYTGLLLFLMVPLGILFELRNEKNISLQKVALSLATPLIIGLLVSSPWWLRNVILTSNPFFPFLWGVFPTYSTEWDGAKANLFNIMLEGYGGSDKNFFDYVLAPFRVFVAARIHDPVRFDGQLGFYYLLGLPIILLFKKLPRKVFYLLGLTVFYLAYWTVSSQQARFLLVILPVLSLFTGLILQMLSDSLKARNKDVAALQGMRVLQIGFMGIVAAAIAINLTSTVMIFKKQNYLGFVNGTVTKQEYLLQKLEYYEIYSYINGNLPENAYLFLIMTGNQGYYLERRFFSDVVFEAETMKDILAGSASADEMLAKFRQRKWTHLLLRRDFFTREFGALIMPEEESRLQEFFDKHLKVIKRSGQFWLFEVQ